MADGYWNGLPTKVRRVTGVVREHTENDPPQAWWKSIVGQRVYAVEVVLDGVNYGGGIAYLYDDDGSGWHKVTKGHGSPRWASKDVPLVDVHDRYEPSDDAAQDAASGAEGDES